MKLFPLVRKLSRLRIRKRDPNKVKIPCLCGGDNNHGVNRLLIHTSLCERDNAQQVGMRQPSDEVPRVLLIRSCTCVKGIMIIVLRRQPVHIAEVLYEGDNDYSVEGILISQSF